MFVFKYFPGLEYICLKFKYFQVLSRSVGTLFNSPCNQFVLLLFSPVSLEGLVFLVLQSCPSGPLDDKYYRRYIIYDMKNEWKTKKSPQWILLDVKGIQIFRILNYFYATNLICDTDPVNFF